MLLPEELIMPLALYAETHFRFFRGMPSLLFRKAPEVIFDLPRRLVSGQDLPLALLINDIHQFPITVQSLQITISQSGSKPELITLNDLEPFLIRHPLQSQMSAFIIPLKRSNLPDGEIFLNARLDYRSVKNARPKGRIKTVLNDNLPTSSKLPLRCTITEFQYPGNQDCTFGDLHCHSEFSRSHVEFGPPLEIISKLAHSSGLHFAAITDHSYDLACLPDNYLKQDQTLGMWHLYQESMNKQLSGIVLIPGEEISCLNSKGRVVHLCGLGLKTLIPGTLDGARPNTYHKTQLTIKQAIQEVTRQGGLAFAAHPGSISSLMQLLFLQRGEWNQEDLSEDLEGIQAVNSGFLQSWNRGKELWITMLQRGLKVPLLAGSDAHGDFNRYRAVGKPFLAIYEGPERYMGFARTSLYGNYSSAPEIIDALRRCATFVTNGPFATISPTQSPADSLISSRMQPKIPENLYAIASSTAEFGPVSRIQVFMGIPGSIGEKVHLSNDCPKDSYDVKLPIPTDSLPQKCYLRMEVNGKSTRNIPTIAATSACFIGY